MTGEFPARMASNAENIFIWWRHHGNSENAMSGVVVRVTWVSLHIVKILRNTIHFIILNSLWMLFHTSKYIDKSIAVFGAEIQKPVVLNWCDSQNDFVSFRIRTDFLYRNDRQLFNSMAPGKCICNVKVAIFKLISREYVMSIICDILSWLPPWWSVFIESGNGLLSGNDFHKLFVFFGFFVCWGGGGGQKHYIKTSIYAFMKMIPYSLILWCITYHIVFFIDSHYISEKSDVMFKRCSWKSRLQRQMFSTFWDSWWIREPVCLVRANGLPFHCASMLKWHCTVP